MSGIIVGILSSTISLSVILLIAAQGEVFVERSGQFNMGIEGIMISGALSSFAGAYISKNPYIGLLFGAVTGLVAGALLYAIIEKMKVNGILAAVVINLLASGVTGFVAIKCLNNGSAPLQCKKITALSIPVLSKIPYIGRILFSQNIIVYLAFLAVPFLHHYLFKTRKGLEIRAVGEDEVAAKTMGINTDLVKLKCFVFGGICAGIAGGYICLTLGMFMDGMTESKGFIAMALCAFSGMNPIGTLLGSVFFAFVDSIQIYLQVLEFNIPYEFMVSLPYVLTIAALVVASIRKNRKPKMKAKTKKKPKKENVKKEFEEDIEYTI